MSKTKQVHHVLKVKKVPPEVKAVVIPPELPEPVKELIAAVQAEELVEFHFANPEPTRWERLKKWFSE